MFSALFSLISLVLDIVGFALVIYCIMSYVAPDNQLFLKMARYVEPILEPFRRLLRKYVPALSKLPVDISPLMVFLIIRIIRGILR